MVMDGTFPAASRADAAFACHHVCLIAEDGLPNQFGDPLPIFKAQPKPVRAGDPVCSRSGNKPGTALPPMIKGRLNRDSNLHGGSPLKESAVARERARMWTPGFCPLSKDRAPKR